jgi:hypothetical protein
MRTAPRSERIRKAPKVHLVNLVENGHDRLLGDLIFQRRDAQRTLAPVGFRDINSSRWLRPVRSPVNPAVKIDEPTLQTVLILAPPDAVHAGGGVPL